MSVTRTKVDFTKPLLCRLINKLSKRVEVVYAGPQTVRHGKPIVDVYRHLILAGTNCRPVYVNDYGMERGKKDALAFVFNELPKPAPAPVPVVVPVHAAPAPSPQLPVIAALRELATIMAEARDEMAELKRMQFKATEASLKAAEAIQKACETLAKSADKSAQEMFQSQVMFVEELKTLLLPFGGQKVGKPVATLKDFADLGKFAAKDPA